MSFIDVMLLAVVGLICGTIGQMTSRYARGGWAVHLSVGIIGAALGVYLSRLLNAPLIYNITVQHSEFPVIWSLVGSVFLVAAIGFLVKPGR